MIRLPKEYILDPFLELLAPSVCLVCDQRHKNRETSFICNECRYNMPFAPIGDEVYNRLFSHFREDDLYLSGAYALMLIKEDNRYMNLIHYLKYYGMRGVGSFLGSMLGRLINNTGKSFDALIPVPIHSARYRERGYNQSLEIAKGVSETTQIPINDKLIKRYRYTQSQTRMTKEQRTQNVRKVYRYKGNGSISGSKKFLLIDDVMTSGSTLNYAALELLNNGAGAVYSATLAIPK